MLRRNRRDTSELNGNLWYQVFKVGFKGQSHMFGLMKGIVIPYSESYFEETKYILVKFYQISCNQEYY